MYKNAHLTMLTFIPKPEQVLEGGGGRGISVEVRGK